MNILHGNCDFDKGRGKKECLFKYVVPAAHQLHSKAHSLFITKEDRSLGPVEQRLIHFRDASVFLCARLRLSSHNSLSSHLSVLITFPQLHNYYKTVMQSRNIRYVKILLRTGIVKS